jgi:hypothetical protein
METEEKKYNAYGGRGANGLPYREVRFFEISQTIVKERKSKYNRNKNFTTKCTVYTSNYYNCTSSPSFSTHASARTSKEEAS